MHRKSLILAAALLLGSFVSGTAHAQQAPSNAARSTYGMHETAAVDQEQARVQTQAEQAIQTLFSRLCPGRCELVGVDVQMNDAKPAAGATPGFDSVGPQAFDVSAKSVTASVLVDSKLPSNFKSNLPRMIEYQLHGLASKVDVHQELLDFPTPQNEPMPPARPEPRRARRAQPPQPPMPQANKDAADKDASPKPAKPAPTKPEPTDWWKKISPIVGAALPWVGLMLVLLLLFALGMVFMQRAAELFIDRASRRDDTAVDEAARPGERADVDALRAELNQSRSLRNQVMRQWVDEDPARVAQLVQLVGPEVLDDLKSDPQLRPQLQAVSQEVAATSEPIEPDEAARLARQARARLNAARLVHQDAALASDWAFLEGLSAGRLRRILRHCTPSEKLYVVGKLPGPLRASYLEGLGADQRREFFSSGSLDALDRSQAQALAARLRQAAEDAAHVGGEVEVRATLMRDMLQAQHLDEQLQSVREMTSYRPEVADALLSMTCLEATATVVPGDVRAEVLHQLPVATLTTFLAGTQPNVKRALLDAAPGEKRRALETELSLDLRTGDREFFEARRVVTDRLEEAIRRGGYDLAAANQQALRLHATNDATPTSAPEVS